MKYPIIPNGLVAVDIIKLSEDFPIGLGVAKPFIASMTFDKKVSEVVKSEMYNAYGFFVGTLELIDGIGTNTLTFSGVTPFNNYKAYITLKYDSGKEVLIVSNEYIV